ncbi:hypothetical protein CUMW_096510 [Citrus unshiu]|uniref:Uncharacterized protein n=1 Tax=Citrus unshiu TaxID=55188 RepID=A0A2H5P1W9_CITUN|nr:hypothetical protein CUMW_096510 [Citrus unshiu]
MVSLKMSREREGGRKNMFGSFRSIFMHADRVDMFLMVLGFIAAICDGLSTPLLTFVMCRLMNNVGNASSLPVDVFTHQLYNAYCWTRTGERQATRMRAVYLKAILRQDVGYFDLHVTSTAEIISSVSNDTLVIQDVLSEKLVVVGFPFVVLLVVLGLIYGRILMVLARKMREEYNKANTIVEQAISSVRTVYAFVGEGKTLDEFSSALQGSVKLGLKQGLCKGFASGINAITYAIWSFLAYYGSRLVMYHGAKGGAVFAAGTTIVVGGQALGAGLSNLKYISEAASAGEHIRDVIKRVPDIDSENMEGEILEKFLGEVEFRNVVFAYPSRPETIIFKDFCLKVPAGNTVALVGGSGSGKSTVVSASLEDGNLKQNNREEDNKKLTAPSFRRLLALNLREWKQASLGCLSAILFGAVQPVYAFAMGSMISVYFLKDHDEIKEKTRFYSLCFFGLSIFSLLTNVCQQYYFAYTGEYLTKRIRKNMLSKILTFEVGWFDQDENSSGAICSRLAKDANVVRSLVGDRVALLVQTLSSITIAFTMSLIISWRLALVIIAVQPLVIVCFYGKEVLLKRMSKKVIKAQDESSKLAAEAVSNLRTITAFSSQERILKMLEKAQEAPRREGVRQSWIAGICLAFSRALVSCVVALAFWYGGRLVARGYINAKSLFEIFLVLVSTGKVIADAGTMTTDIAKGSNAVASVFAVLDRDTKINPEDPKGYRPEKITGHIELQYVHFAYPARPDVMIFKGFSINIVAEKSTALVGQSGSGKSTIIGLIERFYDPLKGAVKIDGEDIRSYHLRSLRRHVALVSQEPALFAGTVRENITYGASDKIDESEIIEAAKAANAHDFIAGLSEGYDTWCGDRGLQLSGGQKQRIAIARAILKNPAVLLLDEATSALDSQSEKLVQEALERLMVGRTSVVVAHRLSTIQNCDMIAVLEQGRVVEEGSHESLLAKGPAGAYYSLVSLQTAEQN